MRFRSNIAAWSNTMGRLFKNLREALSGTAHDYTKVRLSKAIFLLAIPMVMEMVMESVFAVVDIYFVGKLGSQAIATVGITESLLTILYAVAFGLSMGTTALISRRFGEKKVEAACGVAWQAIVVGIVVSLVIALPGFCFAGELLSLMGAEPGIREAYSSYTSIMLGGNIVIMLLFIQNAIFRGVGDAATAMRVLWVANGLNIILDPLLIFGWGPIPAMGVAGAAIATNIGRGIAVIMQLVILFKGSGRIRLQKRFVKIDFSIIKQLIRISLGGIGQSLISTSSWVFMVRIIARFGSDVLAAYTIAIRIIIFSLLPSWGLGNATSTLVGQNLGADQPRRAERAVWFTGKVNMVVLGILSVFFILWPQFFMRLFTQEGKVVEAGIDCLRILSIGLFLYGLGMVLIQALNGAGDTNSPTRINVICFWLIEIPIAYLLAVILGVGENGVYFAIIFAESLMTLFALWVFRTGRWKKKSI